MASTKHERPKADEPETKKAKVAIADSSEAKAKQRVVLNPADCDLDFDVEGDGLQGYALHKEGFAYCWSGARANVGITRGKYCFSCKIISTQLVDMEDTPPDQQHVCRLGISRGDDTVGNLGETDHSFGFGGTGKFSNAGKFSNYGEKFGVGDTIVCAVNLENKPFAFVGFSKNGKWLGTAKQFDAGPKGLGVMDSPMRKLQWESALFPHVLLKNVVVQMQFSIEEGLVPKEGYKPWASALEDGNAIMGPTFSSHSDCEVMMMVGLPASGKTTWVEKWVKEQPEKRYVLLGTNLALDQMKVPGLLRKQNYGERFDRLMTSAEGIFKTLMSRAAKIPRNYILDQTNVYQSARKRKLRPFTNFHKIAVVVFPKPEELKHRAEKRFKEMGKEVPAEAVDAMLANYVLPMSKDMPGSVEYFDEVIFPELNRGESQRYLEEMKHALASTSNLNLKSDSLPYSQENSLQSYNSPSLQNRGASSVTGGPWQSSHSLLPPSNYDYQSAGQVNSAFQGDGLHGRTGSFSGTCESNQNDLVPRGVSFGTYLSSGSGTDPYRSYGVDDPYRRPNIESRNSFPGAVTDPYRSSMIEPYNSYNFERKSFYNSPLVSPRVPFAYNSHGEHTSFPGVPRPDLQALRQPTFVPSPPPSQYGSPYATPTPGPYENYPTDMQHSGVFATPPRPRYY